MIDRTIFLLFALVFLFSSMVPIVDAGFLDKLKEIGETVEKTVKKKVEESIEKVKKPDEEHDRPVQRQRTTGADPITDDQYNVNQIDYVSAPPGIRPLQLATLKGQPVAGFPLAQGIYSKQVVHFGPRKRQKFDYELSRFIDLLKLGAAPEIIQDEQEAWSYAVNFLQDNLKPTYVDESLKIDFSKKYSGWIGRNEFERSEKAKEFIDRFRQPLLNMASRLRREVLLVVLFNVEQYDETRNAFKIIPRIAFRGEFAGGAAHGTSKGTYSFPQYWPVPRDKGTYTINQLNDRIAYLGLVLSLDFDTNPTPQYQGSIKRNNVRIINNPKSAVLYADANLTHQLHEFGIQKTGKTTVAISGYASGLPSSAAVSMPLTTAFSMPQSFGEPQLVTIDMPEDFEPIQFIALDGLPATGWFLEGYLTKSWEEKHGFTPPLDRRLARFSDFLTLRVEPKMLRVLKNAESFAALHLNTQHQEEFLASAGTFAKFGEDEFERKELHKEFLKRYEMPLVQAAPELPFDFLHVDQILIKKYNSYRKEFPFMDTSGSSFLGGGRLSFHKTPIKVAIPESFPASEADAPKVLKKIDGRYAYLATRLQITSYDSAGKMFNITPLGMAIYADKQMSQLLYQFKDFGGVAKQAQLSDAFPVFPHILALLRFRDVPGALNDQELLRLTENQIAQEQREWRSIDRIRAEGYQSNLAQTNFEWQTVMDSRPEFASTDLLEVFMNPNPDWGFVDRETEYGLSPGHSVKVFLFSRQSIDGRKPDFAARELLPVFKQHLGQAIAALPKSFYVEAALPTAAYDHKTHTLQFKDIKYAKGITDILQMLKKNQIEYLAPGEKTKSRSDMLFRAPVSARNMTIYNIPRNNLSSDFVRKQPTHMWMSKQPAHMWKMRGRLSHIAFDRKLKLPSLSMDSSKAEKLLSKLSYRDHLNARIEFEAERVESVDPKKGALLFARLQRVVILKSDGNVIASLGPEVFPSTAEVKEKYVNPAVQFENCNALTSAKEKLECLENISRSELIGNQRYKLDKEMMYLRKKIINEERKAKNLARQKENEAKNLARQKEREADNLARQKEREAYRKESECRSRVISRWKLIEGSEEYEDAIKACMEEEERLPYGPDLLGLRLGMEIGKANMLLQREIDARTGRQTDRASEPRPFDNGTVFISNEHDHYVAYYTLINNGNDRVAAVSRCLHFDDGKMDVNTIRDGLIDKYGQADWTDGNDTMIWLPNPRSETTSADNKSLNLQCNELANTLKPTEWKMANRTNSRSYNMEAQIKNLERLTNNGNVDPKILEAYKKQLETYNLDASGNKRGAYTLMIDPEGGPEDYAKYEACGPILIAKLEKDEDGNLKDAAIVLFDPSWIADLPAAAFKPSGKKKVRF